MPEALLSRPYSDGADYISATTTKTRDDLCPLIKFESKDYRLSSAEMYTLNQFRAPCGSVLNAFLSLLRGHSCVVMGTSFFVNLTEKTTEDMRGWPDSTTVLSRTRKIIIPLSSKKHGHWALAVVKCNSVVVGIFDSLYSRNMFASTYTRITDWLDTARPIPIDGKSTASLLCVAMHM